MKKRGSTILLILVFLFGAGLMLYPTLSEAWNKHHQSRAIVSYTEKITALEDDTNDIIRQMAEEYNREIDPGSISPLSEDRAAEYLRQLDPAGNGIMGYVEIPVIQCSLPVYHGTGKTTLSAAVGHIEWSSLPVGGESTHCVISGHRGLPSAKLFTRLDELREGDEFMLHVLDETLTYEVDQILIVEPDDINSLAVEEGKDYCTLVTCTPYGINTHRLLVRGHRVENAAEAAVRHVTADAVVIRPGSVAPFAAIPLLAVVILWLLIHDSRKKKRKKQSQRREEAKS